MLFRLALVFRDLTSLGGKGGGCWFSSIAASALFLPNVALLLVGSGEVIVEDEDTDLLCVGSLGIGGNVCEFEGGSDLLVGGGRGGTVSFPADDETVILGIFALNELASEEDRFRRPSFSLRLVSVSTAFESSPESITELDSIFLETALSLLASTAG